MANFDTAVHNKFIIKRLLPEFAEFTELGLATGLETADTDEPRQIQNELEFRGRYFNVVFYLTNYLSFS